jgi:hypothetical protein
MAKLERGRMGLIKTPFEAFVPVSASGLIDRPMEKKIAAIRISKSEGPITTY